MMRSLLFWWFTLSLFAGSSTIAQPAKIGDARGLDMLQRMQGNWRVPCQPLKSSAEGSYRILLKVSFTHFDFETREYQDSDCSQERSRRSARYGFRLGGVEATSDGEQAFAIDFQQQTSGTGAYHLAPLNLIRVHSGRMVFGESSDLDVQMRPERLDYHTPFIR